jgi:PAS domain S-box-containing protein
MQGLRHGEQVDLAAENEALRRRVRELEAQRDEPSLASSSLRLLLESAQEGILVARQDDQRILFGNARVSRMLGWSPEELATLRVHDLHPVESRPVVLDCFARQARRELDVAPNLPVLRRDGTLFRADVSSAPVVLDGVACVLGFFHDVTENAAMVDALRRSEERLASVLHHSPYGVHMYDLDAEDRLVFVGANPAADQLLGVDNRQFVGKTLEEAFPPLVQTEVPARYRQVARTGVGWTTEQVDYRDGRIRGAFEVHAFRTGPGRMVASFLEITARKRAEEAVRTLNDELERRVEARTRDLKLANRELEAFAYTVSHDLRTPLRGIDGFAGALLEDCAATLDDTGRHYLARIRENTRHMASLIDGLLALSRVTRHEMVWGPVDLAELARERVRTLHAAEPGRDVGLHVEGDLVVRGDDRLLRTLVGNLIDNAWKFTRRRAAATIEVGREDRDGQPVYRVRDNGAGFDPAYSGKLFEAFQRLHTPQEFEGVGIGLATVQRVVERHGGKVWADSAVGQGATFHFTLPGT